MRLWVLFIIVLTCTPVPSLNSCEHQHVLHRITLRLKCIRHRVKNNTYYQSDVLQTQALLTELTNVFNKLCVACMIYSQAYTQPVLDDL